MPVVLAWVHVSVFNFMFIVSSVLCNEQFWDTFPWQHFFPWHFPDNSLTVNNIPDISLTCFKFLDISRFSRQVVTLRYTLCTCKPAMLMVKKTREVEFSNRHLHISDRKITGAQDFNSAPRLTRNVRLSAPNCVVLEKNFPTRRTFSKRLGFTGSIAPLLLHPDTDVSPSESYGASPVTWDDTVLPATTQHRWTCPVPHIHSQWSPSNTKWCFDVQASIEMPPPTVIPANESPSQVIRLIKLRWLRFLSLQPDTSLHCQTTDTTGLVHRAVCLFIPSFRRYSLHLPPEGWPGWVDLGGWLHTEMAYPSADGHPSKY